MIRIIASGVIALAIAAACSSSPATTTTTTPTSGGATPAGQTPPIGTPAVTPFVSLVPDQPLADAFPDDIGGQPLTVQSASGRSVMGLFGGGVTEAEITGFLTPLNKSIDDLSGAYGYNLIANPTDPNDVGGISIIAIRVRGVATDQLLAAVQALFSSDLTDPVTAPANISGKNVTEIGESDDAPENKSYLYGYSDAVFAVSGNEALVAEAFSKLP